MACLERGLRPDWILFADTGSEYPGTLEHVEAMNELVSLAAPGWPPVTVVWWERVRGPVQGFEPLHETCLRMQQLPSKAYGLAGCTTKWKVQPMDRWRKARGFQQGAFAVGYDAGEARRIQSACRRGDQPGFTAWYPLVAWGVDRQGCQAICDRWGIRVGKSSCFMCPNQRREEWLELREKHPALFDLSVRIEEEAAANGHVGRGGKGLRRNGGGLRALAGGGEDPEASEEDATLEDRCHPGGPLPPWWVFHLTLVRGVAEGCTPG